MKPLYLSPPVRRGLGPCLRPGGLALTGRILDLLAPPAASLVLDAGCGTGASMALLREYGMCRIMGFDIETELACEARRQDLSVALADLARLPLADRCLDLILSECVWNLTDRRGTAGEFARVLRPGGHIALTDIYNRSGKKGDGRPDTSICGGLVGECYGRALAILVDNGFEPTENLHGD